MWQQLTNYGLKLFMQAQPFPKTLIGFDFGLKSTGIAVTSSDMIHAFYLTTIRNDIRSPQFRQKITQILRKQNPTALVIGKPNFVIQSQQKESIIQFIKEFITVIPDQHPKISNYKFTYVDQSWTTQDAKSQLKAIESQVRKWGHLRKQKQLIDGMAAINILRRYLQMYNRN